MYIFKLAIRNFFRNTRRSLISGLSVAIAIMVIIFARSYISGIINNVNENIIRLISGHINIMTPEYKRRERLLPLAESVELNDQLYSTLGNEEITHISPRIKFGVLLGEEEFEVTFGDVVYISPDEVHQLKSIGDEPFGFLCVIPRLYFSSRYINQKNYYNKISVNFSVLAIYS